MVRILLTLSLCFSIICGYGQSGRETFMLTNNDLYFGSLDQSKYEVSDTTTLMLVYLFSHATGVGNESDQTEKTVLQVGAHVTKYFGIVEYYDSFSHTKAKYSPDKKFTATTPEEIAMANAGNRIMPVEIFCRRAAEELEVQNRMPFKDDFRMTYTEKLPLQKWDILPETDSICGYKVQKATTRFGGRCWYAWFAPELPVSVGPWKFFGLPGIILKAYDSQKQFIFDCIQISNKKFPIYNYIVPQKSITKTQWLKFIKRAYENPYTEFGNGGINKFYMSDKTGIVELDNSWTIPYNPIELE